MPQQKPGHGCLTAMAPELTVTDRAPAPESVTRTQDRLFKDLAMSADELQSASPPSNVTETQPASQPAGSTAVTERPAVALGPLSAPPTPGDTRPPRFSLFEG